MYCYDDFSTAIYETLRFGLFSPEVPVLVYYSHLTAIIVSVSLSLFILANANTLAARILAGISFLFTTLAVLDILLWTLIDVRWIMFLWSFWLFLFISIYVLGIYFLYTFLYKKDVSFGWKVAGFAILSAVLAKSGSSFNLSAFDVGNCAAVENVIGLNTVFAISIAIFLGAAYMGLSHMRKLTDHAERMKTLLATVGICLFLFAFSAAAYYASITNLLGASPETFALEQYGYFGMTAFIAFLAYTIVQYRAFNVRLIAAQALVVSLVILIASQFFFIRNPINYNLNSIALVISIGFGYLLVKSVKREIEQRERIETLARDLEVANTQQTTLIRFITHQLKGFMSKSRNIFSMIQEGDFGPVPEPIKPLMLEGFNSATKGAQTIQEILNASNLKSGRVAYQKAPLDFAELVRSVVAVQAPIAHGKNLTLTLTGADEPLMLSGDRMQLENAVRNLVDNSIKYTLQGGVTITLTHDATATRLTIADTGVGITAEDMVNLFTEGGHGKESQKVNVDSTGFGLYIVKNIVEAHGGKAWAESEGAGKGARFIVELPAA